MTGEFLDIAEDAPRCTLLSNTVDSLAAAHQFSSTAAWRVPYLALAEHVPDLEQKLVAIFIDSKTRGPLQAARH